MSDLKPCPCCGHRAIELWQERTSYDDWWTIRCLNCDLMVEGSDRQAVIERWQRRRTDGMIAWLDAEIEKWRHLNGVQLLHAVNRRDALIQCKKQLLKLLDGMGVE